MTPKPNIILVLTDDQGYGDLGCHGNPVLRTPHMDALHGVSFRLSNYHVGPTCAPTRAGLYTGHYHNSTGVWHTIGGRSLLRRDEWSLADALSGAGYATGLFGKWHLGDAYPYRPEDRGFQEVVTHGGGGVGNTPDHWGNAYRDDHYRRNGQWRPYEGYCTDVWFREGLGFIERHRAEPFFCCITTNAPHSPYIVDPEYAEPYIGRVEHRDRANFNGMIACIDENLGLLRRRLDEWGLAENTLFIFMTDNGTSGGATPGADGHILAGYIAGMRGIKGSEYEGGHRVPCFLHWPAGGMAEGRDIPQLTANVDLMPTLLDLCDVDPGAHAFDGRSLAPLLRGDATDWPDRIMVTDSQRVTNPIKWRKSATMTGRWRLVNGVELYDMPVDAGQRRDVAAEHPDVVARLREGYEAWWAVVSRQFDGTIPIPIGTLPGEVTLLNAHDWRNDPVECAWNQSLVREGLQANGYWEAEIAAAGRYRFELRRWPREEDRPMAEGIPGEVTPYNDLARGYGGGRALGLVRARLRVGDRVLEAEVPAGACDVAFEADLRPGETQVQTYLFDAEGAEWGAYYVYAWRLPG